MGISHAAGGDVLARRIGLLQQVVAGELTQRAASTQLGLSYRQIKRLVARYRLYGPAGLSAPPRRTGLGANNDRDERILTALREENLSGGLALTQQVLRERHGLVIGRGALRSLLQRTDASAVGPSDRRLVVPPAIRRQFLGELVHIAGCSYRWFGTDAASCTLLVYYDDATGRLQLLRFIEGDATFDYMQAAKVYLLRYGKPVAFCDNKQATARRGAGGAYGTQYARAITELGIALLPGAPPPMRARIRRMLVTLRNRIFKELSRRAIKSIGTANRWADGFTASYNARYARQPARPEDKHRPVLASDNLDETFTWRESRTLSAELSLQYDNVLYLVEHLPENLRLAGERVLVIEFPDGSIKIRHRERDLAYRQFDKQATIANASPAEHRRLGALLSMRSGQSPPASFRGVNVRDNPRYVTRMRVRPEEPSSEIAWSVPGSGISARPPRAR